jgi:hypothetical protein
MKFWRVALVAGVLGMSIGYAGAAFAGLERSLWKTYTVNTSLTRIHPWS